MHKVRLLILACLALFAFGAFAAQAAMAEDTKFPEVLLLSGNASEVEATLKGGKSTLEAASGKTITAETVESTLKGCKAESGKELDFSLCAPVLLDFHGVKKEAVECRSEMTNKEQKDPIGLVLVWVDLHLANEKVGSELEPLLLFKVLGALALETSEELQLNCGGVAEHVKGVIACLLTPGLEDIPATTGILTISCKIKAPKTGEGEKGECELLCEWLTNTFLANLGLGFEKAWMSAEATGSPNKDILIDD